MHPELERPDHEEVVPLDLEPVEVVQPVLEPLEVVHPELERPDRLVDVVAGVVGLGDEDEPQGVGQRLQREGRHLLLGGVLRLADVDEEDEHRALEVDLQDEQRGDVQQATEPPQRGHH